MKKFLSLIALSSTALSAASAAEISPYHGKDFSDWGKLTIVGNQLSSFKTKEAVQLKGWSTTNLNLDEVQTCSGESQWSLMKQYGANVVRLSLYVDGNNTYTTDPTTYKQRVKQSIEELAKLNMYCLVDWHIGDVDGHTGNPNDYLNEARAFFAEISAFCSANDYTNVLYEICSEPTCGWPKVKDYAESVIVDITRNQPDAIIIVGVDQWGQKIMEPVANPIANRWWANVMYSFHYSACSHYSLLGDFRAAQSNIPVFVSEWSAVKFDGKGPYCESNSDELISACDSLASAPQLVSWCIWNWGKKDDASSFFNGICAEGSESDSLGINSNKTYGEYVKELMHGEMRQEKVCDCGVAPTINSISSTASSAWHWDYYDLGGEGFAYHDRNSSAWKKDSEGNVVDYANDGDEVDVYSLAREMQWIDKDCPWATVKDGKVVSFDESIATVWKNYDGDSTYRSLNGGRMYYGTEGSARPDEGVDLNAASCLGTDYENMGYSSIGWVEEGEWINYTVNVAEPGYYKISAVVSSEYSAPLRKGEISITSKNGNLLRDGSGKHYYDPDFITTFGFPLVAECDDRTKTAAFTWDCWSTVDARSENVDDVCCLFTTAGKQEITISFVGNAGGVGPLIFTFYKEYIPYQHPNCVHLPEGCGDEDSVNDIDVTKFSIAPNPTSGEFTVTLAENAEATVDVINMAGQIVASQKIDGSATISNPLASGVYTVVVKSEGAVGTQKLIVK